MSKNPSRRVRLLEMGGRDKNLCLDPIIELIVELVIEKNPNTL